MVTKPCSHMCFWSDSLILAKIHMVTKPKSMNLSELCGLILAKIHMVTKPQIHHSIYLIIIN